MNWALILLSIQFTWIPPGLGTYHIPTSKWLTETMTQPNAYFGYSITYVPSMKRLIVSAPQADNIGKIYSCDIDKRTCLKVPRNITRDDKYSHSYWLGATVKAGTSYFVTCAPLTTDRHKFGNNYYPIGTFSRCYKYRDPEQLPIDLYRFSLDEGEESYVKKFEKTMTSFGWSIDVSGNDIIIGGPAMYTGRVVKYVAEDQNPVNLTGISTPTNKGVEYNFGYSVVLGCFSYATSKYYAIGSTYGNAGFGKISFYRSIQKKLIYSGDLTAGDDSVGSMFGAVLCTALLKRGTHAAALLVGAPTYSTKDVENLGAVFVYAPARAIKGITLKKKLVGYKPNSYFGSAIVNVGDLNGDGLDEIVIGAPYEDSGTGAIYLYSSADLNNVEKNDIAWLQRIVPEPDARQRSFGLSLTAIKDYDENGCNELAVGAPETNSVKVFRCIASVPVVLYQEIPELREFKSKSFTFKSCLKVTYAKKPNPATAKIKIQVQIIHQKAELANSEDKEYIVDLDGTQTSMCRPITVNVNQTRETGTDPAMNIVYKIKATQLNHPEDSTEFNPANVALSDLSKLDSTGSIWITECKNQQFCVPDLKYVDSGTVTYEIGSTKTFDVDITVRNDGEAAYDSCLGVTIVGAYVMTSPQECERISRTELKCTPKRIFQTSAIWSTQLISLETTHLTTDHNNITVDVKIYNHCSKTEFTPVQKVIYLKANPDKVVISGVTDTSLDNTVNSTTSEVASGKDFDHIYTISNFGNTTWVGVNATVKMQKRPFIVNSSITFYTKDSPRAEKCKYDSEDEIEATFICEIDRLYNISFARVIVPMFISPGVLETVIKDKENTVYSSLSIDLVHNTKKVNKSKLITSTLLLHDDRVEWWVYLIAIIMGLIILVVLFFILKSCGFFERKTKEKLEQVQRNVKRQTILRRSMIDGHRLPPGPDRQSLIQPESAQQAVRADRRRIQP